MPSKDDVHVTPRDDGRWQGKRPGNDRASFVTDTQHEAIDRGRELRGPDKGELVVHGRDGQIRYRDTAPGANDPPPPGSPG